MDFDLSHKPTLSYQAINEIIDAGSPLCGEVTSVFSENCIEVELVLPFLQCKTGSKLKVKQIDNYKHRDMLQNHIKGSQYTPALQVGDVIMFSSASIYGREVVVDKVSGRTHDNMKGHVQFAYGLARPSLPTISKKGAQQYITVIEPSSAKCFKYSDRLRAFIESVSQRDHSFKCGGVLVRNKKGYVYEFFLSKDCPLDSVIETLEDKGWIGDGDSWVEAIPAWRYSVALEQIARDVDVKQHVSRALGMLGKKYLCPEIKYTGFRPTGFIMFDDDEYSFGGKTGKIIRSVSGIQPFGKPAPIPPAKIPTATFKDFGSVVPLNFLYRAETLEKLATERKARNPKLTTNSAKNEPYFLAPEKQALPDISFDAPKPSSVRMPPPRAVLPPTMRR